MSKTKIVSTSKGGRKSKKGKKGFTSMTKKVRRTHKGYGMKGIVKSHMTYKRGKKR